MFEDLFANGRTVENYWDAPHLEERLSYLLHCADAGAQSRTLRRIAAHQISLVRFLDLRAGERVNLAQVEAASRQWSLPGGRHSRRPAGPQARRRFFGNATRWLRFADMLEEAAPRHAHAGQVAVFEAWMRNERGWSEASILCCLATVDRFFDGLAERGVALHAVRITDIDREAALWLGRGCGRVTVHDYAQRLRTLLPLRRTPGLVHIGIGRRDHAVPVPSRRAPPAGTGT